ncbi:MAG TPA: glycine oxidase ThiO [bacterium]
MDRFDIVILGGGVIGCALADELSRHGRRVALLERGRIGGEASSAAAGVLSAQTDLRRHDEVFELCQAARRMYPEWVRHLESRSGTSIGLTANGILYLAHTRKDALAHRRQLAWQRRVGLKVERWSAAKVRRREPAVDGPVTEGFFFPTEAQLDNVRLMEALAAVCRVSGVDVREHTEVRALLVRNRHVRGVRTAAGAFHAPVVVNCLGSWAGKLAGAPRLVRVRPARGQILVFHSPTRLIRRTLMSEHAYATQRSDGRIVVGSTVEMAGFEKRLTLGGMSKILRGLKLMTSSADACPLVDAWAGLRPYPADERPVMGATRLRGYYAATGHFRHGILLAPVTAALMAELILRDRTSLDLTPFSPLRPS